MKPCCATTDDLKRKWILCESRRWDHVKQPKSGPMLNNLVITKRLENLFYLIVSRSECLWTKLAFLGEMTSEHVLCCAVRCRGESRRARTSPLVSSHFSRHASKICGSPAWTEAGQASLPASWQPLGRLPKPHHVGQSPPAGGPAIGSRSTAATGQLIRWHKTTLGAKNYLFRVFTSSLKVSLSTSFVVPFFGKLGGPIAEWSIGHQTYRLR